jgi:hypothetical protein
MNYLKTKWIKNNIIINISDILNLVKDYPIYYFDINYLKKHCLNISDVDRIDKANLDYPILNIY